MQYGDNQHALPPEHAAASHLQVNAMQRQKSIDVPQLSPSRRGQVVFVARRDAGYPLRLDYAKAELALRDWGIRSTIIVFGGARVPSPRAGQQPQLGRRVVLWKGRPLSG